MIHIVLGIALIVLNVYLGITIGVSWLTVIGVSAAVIETCCGVAIRVLKRSRF